MVKSAWILPLGSTLTHVKGAIAQIEKYRGRVTYIETLPDGRTQINYTEKEYICDPDDPEKSLGT